VEGLLPGWGGDHLSFPSHSPDPLSSGQHRDQTIQDSSLGQPRSKYSESVPPPQAQGEEATTLASNSSHHHGRELKQLFKQMSTQSPEHPFMAALSQRGGGWGEEPGQEAPQESWLHFLNPCHVQPGLTPCVHFPSYALTLRNEDGTTSLSR
jgi:hypothetical protein